MSKAIWILHDQCDPNSHLLDFVESHDHIIMVESVKDLDLPYTHKKKTAFILAVQRHFVENLKKRFHHVHVVSLNESKQRTQLETMVDVSQQYGLHQVLMIQPRVASHRQYLSSLTHLNITYVKDEGFISDESFMLPWFKAKSFRMETFYQTMRKSTGLLMEPHGQPMGGQFNFDKANQKPLKHQPPRFSRISFKKDAITLQVIHDVNQWFAHQLGDLDSFYFSTTRAQALKECSHFIKHILPYFGSTQDNMVKDDAYMAHSLLSAYINIGLLRPLEVCQAAHDAVVKEEVSIESGEGFIRQILGWREFMFYKYLSLMPHLLDNPSLKQGHPLPSLYWGGSTHMNCLHHVVKDSLDHAYSHHIQRLMISANFANLAQIRPFEVHEWFLGIYADAYEWVEVPNTIGMGLYQDGGHIGSKPYIASGAYIHKMSNYCEGCKYNPKQLIGEDACPLNSLYWNYIADHKDTLKKNPRMSMMVASFERFDKDKKQAITSQANANLQKLKRGEL